MISNGDVPPTAARPSSHSAQQPHIRSAQAEDIAAIARIYREHVVDGTGSFEERPPDDAEMGRRRDAIVSRGLPYLVAEADAIVYGFAYAGLFRTRSAYRFTVEDSVYVAREAAGRGVGSLLLAELIRRCTDLGYRQMVAVIGDSANARSIALHRRLGFRDAGHLRAVGYKFDRWLDIVFMQRTLTDNDRAG